MVDGLRQGVGRVAVAEHMPDQAVVERLLDWAAVVEQMVGRVTVERVVGQAAMERMVKAWTVLMWQLLPHLHIFICSWSDTGPTD